MSEPTRLRIVRPGDDAGAAGEFHRPRSSWAADELMAMEFAPPRWAVPGFLAEGVNLLAGPPKVGKSWLSLGLALDVAAGATTLGTVEVEAGPVLYLALEDTPRRLQSRMRKILDGRRAPHGLTLATTCPPLPEGGAAHIDGWLTRNPGARMVVIDVFAKVRGRPPAGVSAYDADYAAIGYAKRLADEHAVAVVLVHHVRKAGADDFLAEVSGTNGLAGAADATLVLKRPRGEADGILYVTGRDVDEAEHPLRFAPETGTWALLDGPAVDYTVSGTRAAILRNLRAFPGSTPRAIADATGIGYDNVKKACQRMAADGQLIADTAGRYRPADTPGTGTPESVPGVPGVPEPLPNCGNDADEPGTPPETPVPGVPGPVVETALDRLARGESAPGEPSACGGCGHHRIFHGETYRHRRTPCRKCDCPAYTDQEPQQ
jgi:AAA domain